MHFIGSKIALYVGGNLAVIRRDTFPGLPYPDHWDLPGGGREGDETPLACALRETREELALHVPPSAIRWQQAFMRKSTVRWFFVAEIEATAAAEITLGSEGQEWCLMSEDAYIAHPMGIASFQARIRLWQVLRKKELLSEKPPAA
ncbi:NUDIX hydrolase [Sulfitobacter sp. S190]|uniref:NUDIX hydrolase n=1 Tax=Sulfitobacter sp. S190 TaxID=2867022 RepID=UPI0021A2FD19|nr:NUDIX hydrolase [Sulfitobacter sp. S190]UWR22156.1 NUDIX hydrolase [Sulfitobacter sp. S190]